jgi:hypothetical protein
MAASIFAASRYDQNQGVKLPRRCCTPFFTVALRQ